MLRDSDVPAVSDQQLRFIWGALHAMPGERPLAAALEQALTAARSALPELVPTYRDLTDD
jgi:hypothetical protein